MNDAEIQQMQDQIRKESGMEVEDGGIDLPDDMDGVVRVPKDDMQQRDDNFTDEPEDEGEM